MLRREIFKLSVPDVGLCCLILLLARADAIKELAVARPTLQSRYTQLICTLGAVVVQSKSSM